MGMLRLAPATAYWKPRRTDRICECFCFKLFSSIPPHTPPATAHVSHHQTIPGRLQARALSQQHLTLLETRCRITSDSTVTSDSTSRQSWTGDFLPFRVITRSFRDRQCLVPTSLARRKKVKFKKKVCGRRKGTKECWMMQPTVKDNNKTC